MWEMRRRSVGAVENVLQARWANSETSDDWGSCTGDGCMGIGSCDREHSAARVEFARGHSAQLERLAVAVLRGSVGVGGRAGQWQWQWWWWLSLASRRSQPRDRSAQQPMAGDGGTERPWARR